MPRTSISPRQTASTRARMIAAMADLMWHSGYSAVSVEDICKKAKANKGSFYHFFASKAELAVVVCETEWEQHRTLLDTVFSPERRPLLRIREFLRLVEAEQVAKHAQYGFVVGCPFCTLGSEMATQDETIRRRITAIFEAHWRYLETALRDAVAEGSLSPAMDVRAKAEEIDTLMTGAMLSARIRNSFEPVGAALVNAVFDCLGTTPPSQ